MAESFLNKPQVFEVVREHFCEDRWSPEGNIESFGSSSAVGNLRRHSKPRHSKSYQEGRGKIHDCPREVESRAEIGHWEDDTVLGKSGRAYVVTFIDRKFVTCLWAKLLKDFEQLNEAMAW